MSIQILYLTLKDICTAYGVSTGFVKKHSKDMGVYFSRPRRFDPFLVTKFFAERATENFLKNSRDKNKKERTAVLVDSIVNDVFTKRGLGKPGPIRINSKDERKTA